MANNVFSSDDIKRIARLSALEIDPQNIPAYCESLSSTFNMINQLLDINTDNIAPMSHPLDAKQRMRKDEVTVGDHRDLLLACSPDTEAGLVLVPKVIE